MDQQQEVWDPEWPPVEVDMDYYEDALIPVAGLDDDEDQDHGEEPVDDLMQLLLHPLHQANPDVSIDILPPELLPHIFRFLPIHVRFLIQSVSRRWCEMAQFSIRKQENLVVKSAKQQPRSPCQPHELPDRFLSGIRYCTHPELITGLLSGLKSVKLWPDLTTLTPACYGVNVLAQILKVSSESVTHVSAPSVVIAVFMSKSPVTLPAVRVLETDVNVARSLRFFPNLEKLVIRAIDMRTIDSLPSSVTCIDAPSGRHDLGWRGVLPVEHETGRATKKFPWLLQLKEIRIPYPFTDEDIRTLIANPKLEVLRVPNQLNDLSTGTISSLIRSNLRTLLISDSKIRMNFTTEDNGTKVITITESGSLRNLSSLIDSLSMSIGFRLTHSLNTGTSEYEVSYWRKSPLRGMKLRSSSWTNTEFKAFISKLSISRSCSNLKVEVHQLLPDAEMLKSIAVQFPHLQQLHFTVDKYVGEDMDQLLAMTELNDVIIRSTIQDVIPAPELEGMAVIERMNDGSRQSPAKVVPQSHGPPAASSSSTRSILKFDVPQYTADAVFFFTLANRNPFLQRIDVSMCNFYGRNLSPLQDLKYLRELSIRISSKLPLSVEMLGSILSGFKNKELIFSLKTFWERNEVSAEIQDYKLTRLSVTQTTDWESTQANNWPRLLSQFSSLTELELNGIGCGYNVISRNRRLKNLTWDKLDDDALISFSENLPQLECISCFEKSDVTTTGLMTLLQGKARECLRRIDLPMAVTLLDIKRLTNEVKAIQSVTNRKILLFVGE